MTHTPSRAPSRTSLRSTNRINACDSLESMPDEMSPNNDDEERRKAQNTLLAVNNKHNTSSCYEESKTLKECLEIFSGNKLNRDNAWSLSLIDSLSKLVEHHHTSLSNFRVVGTSLEASTKVYSLRVDSIHTEVLRIAAGLNAQRLDESQNENEEGNDGNAGDQQEEESDKRQKATKQKRVRNTKATVTKNKETLNARLDTVSIQYPIYAKLNSAIGSIISPVRLLNNVLLTINSELQLNTTFPIWDPTILRDIDYTDELTYKPPEMTENDGNADSNILMMNCEMLLQLDNLDQKYIRPLHSGYRITDTPDFNPILEDRDHSVDRNHSQEHSMPDNMPLRDENSIFHNENEVSMIFDINAECEPMPNTEPEPMLCLNLEELGDISPDDYVILSKCKSLHERAVVLEDLRPVNHSHELEYSYRPLEPISKFWAGPSFWKIRKTQNEEKTVSILSGAMSINRTDSNNMTNSIVNIVNERKKPGRKPRGKQPQPYEIVELPEESDRLIPYDIGKPLQRRKVNIKKWNAKALRLPSDHKVDAIGCSILNIYLDQEYNPNAQDDEEGTPYVSFLDHDDPDGCPKSTDVSLRHEIGGGESFNDIGGNDSIPNIPESADALEHNNSMVMEIPTQYSNAPVRVERILLPFSKRAKKIDMKNLKRSCSLLLTKQLHTTPESKIDEIESQLTTPPSETNVKYDNGIVGFNSIYKELPNILDSKNAEAVSFATTFYAVLHLANEQNLHLFQQLDLEDFQIRKITS